MSLILNDRVALITGAGRGIGKAVAEELARRNVTVVCVSKSDSCKETAQNIVKNGGKADAFVVDVSKYDEVKSCCAKVLEKYGTVDILVNNAGIIRDKLLIRMSVEDWNDVIATNLNSVFYWTKELLRPMTDQRWGRIINISSVIGLMGNAGQSNYAAAKAGIIGFTKSVAKEVGGRSITVNAIAPGFIDTDMTKNLSEAILDHLMKLIPLKRFGKVADVANMVAFLASEEAGYITGQTFTVDGGMVM
jgi:3-oxoacyl-[acyl-carrier protein] reductase